MSNTPSTTGAGGAEAIEAMLNDVVTPDVADAPVSASIRPAQARGVRPLWSADAMLQRGQWLRSRWLWALLGLAVGIAGTSLVHELRRLQQREAALASYYGRVAQGVVATAPVPVPAPALAAPTAPLPVPASGAAVAPVEPSPVASSTAIGGLPPTEGAGVAVAAAETSPKAVPPAAVPVRKAAPRRDSPAAHCTVRTSAAFQRCMEAQCRRARFSEHRQCIAVRERTAAAEAR